MGKFLNITTVLVCCCEHIRCFTVLSYDLSLSNTNYTNYTKINQSDIFLNKFDIYKTVSIKVFIQI